MAQDTNWEWWIRWCMQCHTQYDDVLAWFTMESLLKTVLYHIIWKKKYKALLIRCNSRSYLFQSVDQRSVLLWNIAQHVLFATRVDLNIYMCLCMFVHSSVRWFHLVGGCNLVHTLWVRLRPRPRLERERE